MMRMPDPRLALLGGDPGSMQMGVPAGMGGMRGGYGNDMRAMPMSPMGDGLKSMPTARKKGNARPRLVNRSRSQGQGGPQGMPSGGFQMGGGPQSMNGGGYQMGGGPQSMNGGGYQMGGGGPFGQQMSPIYAWLAARRAMMGGGQ